MITAAQLEEIRSARWKILHRGAWRPITQLIRGDEVVAHPAKALACVFYCPTPEGEWVAFQLGQGEVIARRQPDECLEEVPWRVDG